MVGASLHEQQILFLREVLRNVLGHLALMRLPTAALAQIQLVANEHDHNIRFCVLLDFIDPLLDRLKGAHLRYVVHDKGADRFPIVR